MSGRTPPRHVASNAEMRWLDERTITSGRVSGRVLMERAGAGASRVAQAMLARRGFTTNARVEVIAGAGNNGGDGYVVARLLRAAGHTVTVRLLVDAERVRGDAALQLEAWRACGGTVSDGRDGLVQAEYALAKADLVVDAIFGTGLNQEVREPFRGAILRINASGRPTLALDIPSGVDGDRGEVLGVAVRADETVSFAFPKRGHYLFPGAALTGRLHVADIGLPEDVVAERPPACRLITEADARARLPARPRDAHKGTFGHVLVVGGDVGRTGAALLAGQAAGRSGAGLVTLASTEEGRRALDAKVVEAMTESVGERFDARALPALLSLVRTRDALVLGPGLGQGDGVSAMLREFLGALQIPTVLDADALNVVARDLSMLDAVAAPLVLTPHPGEMARLCGASAQDVQRDRMGVASTFARAHGVCVVLKGAYTVVAAPDGALFVNTTGNAGLATGGSGDVLAGILGALLASGVDALGAALLAVYAHGAAGDVAAARVGQVGLVAHDVVLALPEVWKSWTAP